MKTFVRNSLLAFLLSFSFTNVKAQYVTIPDNNFVSWLNFHGYSSCMNGNQMDTTCSQVVNAATMNCAFSNIADLTGITYFDSLTTLNCGNNQLVTMPDLPSSLISLFCEDNQLTSIPSLPSSLAYLSCHNNQLIFLPVLPSSLCFLYCFDNQLTSLPPLPSSLTHLYCLRNQLTSLPPLPASLTVLRCYSNQLTSLPPLPAFLNSLVCFNNQLSSLPPLPASLTFLSCYNNQLTSLPVLPSSLLTLSCSSNQLISLPPLPDSLSTLWCGTNQLTTLPFLPALLNYLRCDSNQLTSLPALPSSLIYLFCSGNQLTSLPSLPSSLNILDCGNNQLTSLPPLPSSLIDLYCNNNQLISLPALNDTMYNLNISNNPGLICLPPIHQIDYFYWDSTGITCLPYSIDITQSSIPSISSLPICNIFNNNNCPVHWNISGSLYNDSITNCLKDSADPVYSNIKMNLYSNGNLVQQTFSNSLGQYTFDADTGNYIYAPDSNSVYTVVCPLSGVHTSNLTALDSVDTDMDFALGCKPGFDVGVVSIHRTGVFRPANFATVNVLAGDLSNQFNLHCANGISGTVTVVINGPANYGSAVSGALMPVVNGDTLVYTIADFGIIDFYHDFSFMVQTDTTAQANQQVCFEVTVTPLTGDNNTANNYYSHCFTVVNSYDPNVKEVSPTGLTDTSQYWLTYTVQFQNTGNAPAQHIYILDTLDNNIDESSIQLLAYSHEPLVQVTSNVVKFNFPNINLADSVNDEPNSHGYVQYKVRRNYNLPIGTQISNTAYIYFDFNPPVQTNTTTNQLAVLASVASTQTDNTTFSIFPNPMSSGNMLNLFFNSPANQRATFTVYELSGRKVFTQPIVSSAQSQQVNLPDLSQGIYQCVVDYESGRAQQKLVVVE